MAIEDRVTLKTYFETGDKPTQAEFINLIDSCLNLFDDTVGEANTMSSLGGESLVGTKSGVVLPIKGLTAGTNITFGVNGTAITLNATDTNTTYTGSQGIYLDGTNFTLGGSYTTARTIESSNAVDFIISNNNNGLQQLLINGTGFTLSSNDSGNWQGAFSSSAGASGAVEMYNFESGSGMLLQMHAANGIIFTDATFSKGVVYAADYSANSTARSLIDKAEIQALITASGGGTNIKDGATTTGLYTEETADRLVGHSANTGTDLIFEMFEGTGTPVSVFQVDGEGSLLNNGLYRFARLGSTVVVGTNKAHSGVSGASNNTGVGNGALEDLTSGDRNTAIGGGAGATLTTQSENTLIGALAGWKCRGNYNTFTGSYSGENSAGGSQNIFYGAWSGNSNTSQDKNMYFGYYSGYLNAGNQNIFIGNESGRYQTTVSDKLLINNRDHLTAGAELTNSIIYGVMAAAPADQDLTFNANVFLSQIKSGATQVGAGAAVNEIWKTASHATLPDNVLMIGV